MDSFYLLSDGFSVALMPANLLACLIGVVLGTLVGVLPGIGPVTTMAMLLPLAYGSSPTTMLILFSGIFYGSKYGGSVTSILMNIPGEGSSVMTCVDGYQMAKKGRAGAAIGIAAIASFVAGTMGVIGLMLLAPPMATFALSFGPPEYTALVVMGLTCIAFLSGTSMTKALLMGCLGLALTLPGIDPISGDERLTLGLPFLISGVDFVVVGVGIFAVGEVLYNIETHSAAAVFTAPKKFWELMPTIEDIRRSTVPILGSTVLGFLVGVLPGGNPGIATFLSYGATKALSKDKELFGTGDIRGVAAPESADNAAVSGSLVPLMTLGIPGTGATAMMLAALILAGLQPGPLLIQEQPEFFWAVIASMYVGNVLLLIINLPLAPVLAKILLVPYRILYPFILVVCTIGTYSVNNSLTDVWLLGFFGLVGYLMRKLDLPAVPLVLAVVLGPILENSLRQTMTLFDGDLTQFLQRPIAASLLAVATLMFVTPVTRSILKWRSELAAAKST